MNPAAIVLFILACNSALLSVALFVAWRRFGRELHAAIWSLSYALSAISWLSNLAEVTVLPHRPLMGLLTSTLAIIDLALVAVGFRRRAGLPARSALFVGGTVLAILLEADALFVNVHVGVQRAVVLGFCALMLAIAAAPQRPGWKDGGNSAFWMLSLFAIYAVVLGGFALRMPASGAGPAHDVYRLMMLLGVPIGMFGVGLFAMLLLAGDLAGALRRLASSDPLTGVLNRRGFEQASTPLFAQCRRQRRALAVVIADLDRFKAINDRFGHGVGDAALKRFAGHVCGRMREGDLFGRLGGEEFIFVLPDTDAASAEQAIERIRCDLATVTHDLIPTGMTVSYGIATLDDPAESLGDVMQRADHALYRSKVEGRDRITVALSPMPAAEPVCGAWPVEALRRVNA